MLIRGRGVSKGTGRGALLISPAPISFLSGVDATSGVIVETGHPLKGESVAGRVLAFPFGKGSTVGSYVLYALRRNGVAPAGIVNAEAEPIITVGAIIAGIPLIDHLEVPLNRLKSGVCSVVHGDTGMLEYEGELVE
jgi:predicted aconitase with swiveling domain